MKLFMMAFLSFLIFGTVFYIKEDPFSKGRYSIYDENYQRTGYIIQDRLYPNKSIIYDNTWQRTGCLLKDIFNKSQIRLDRTD